MNLSKTNYIKACIAKWIVVNIACRIHPMAVLSLCVETSRKYDEARKS